MKLDNLIQEGVSCPDRMPYPYFIAEAGVNHEGKMENARRLIEEAAEAGADAIKFQTYKAETLASKESPAYWDTDLEKTENQYLLFKKHDSFWKREFEELKLHCDAQGIEFISTPFDLESATFLNDLMSVFKISSSDITNKPFIDFICSFDKPIILSTGASETEEIEEAVDWIESKGNSYALLHCVLCYPTDEEDANLGMILDLKKRYPEVLIGYSDHTRPSDGSVLQIATTLGASIIEKHFTYDKTLPGNDHYHAMDKVDLKLTLEKIGRVISIVGSRRKGTIDSEITARNNARRSLVAARDIGKDTVVGPDDLTWKRPASGISPKFLNEVVGKRTNVEILEDQVLFWKMLK